MEIFERVNAQKIEEFCRRRHIRSLAVFGSALGDQFRTDSDVDMLVEFDEGIHPGLDFFTMQEELSSILGRQVDLNTPGFLSPHFRGDALKAARTVYAHA